MIDQIVIRTSLVIQSYLTLESLGLKELDRVALVPISVLGRKVSAEDMACYRGHFELGCLIENGP